MNFVTVTSELMESDDIFSNLDWDPCYLASIFYREFYDISDLWNEELVSDSELLKMDQKDIYCPIVEDISLGDEVLVKAVDRIESE